MRQLLCSVIAGCLLSACQRANAQEADGTQPPLFQLRVERVLIPAVVRDRNGRIIDNLKQGDFQVFDDGKLRPISSFMIEHREAETPSKSGAPRPAPATAAGFPKATMFVFDDLHVEAADLVRARSAAISVISDALTGNDVAGVVSMSGLVNSGYTRDPIRLQSALNQLAPHPCFRPSASDCPYIDYYEADQLANRHDPSATEDVLRKYRACTGKPADPGTMNSERIPIDLKMQLESSARRVLTAGRYDVERTLATLAGLVQGMNQLPARRSIVLISPGFLTIEPETLMDESRVLDLAARSNVTISTLDARGLYNAGFRASESSSGMNGPNQGSSAAFTREPTTQTEDVLASLAEGTGGMYFHNSNDLNAGLKQLSNHPETLYLLEISAEGSKRNGALHKLEVKVNRDGAQVKARRAYFIPKEDKNTK